MSRGHTLKWHNNTPCTPPCRAPSSQPHPGPSGSGPPVRHSHTGQESRAPFVLRTPARVGTAGPGRREAATVSAHSLSRSPQTPLQACRPGPTSPPSQQAGHAAPAILSPSWPEDMLLHWPPPWPLSHHDCNQGKGWNPGLHPPPGSPNSPLAVPLAQPPHIHTLPRPPARPQTARCVSSGPEQVLGRDLCLGSTCDSMDWESDTGCSGKRWALPDPWKAFLRAGLTL